jgi:hypothetical protein
LNWFTHKLSFISRFLRGLFQRAEISFFATFHGTFSDGFQFLPARADLFYIPCLPICPSSFVSRIVCKSLLKTIAGESATHIFTKKKAAE